MYSCLYNDSVCNVYENIYKLNELYFIHKDLGLSLLPLGNM